MLSLLSTPDPGDPVVPWDALQVFPWIRELQDCPQDPIHHAEGNVWIHTRMVLEALVALPAWRALPEEDRAVTWIAALMHDIGKPATTVTEPDGRVTARGHSRLGDRMARRLLWRLGAPFALREAVCAAIRYHQIPFFCVDQEPARAQRTLCELSWGGRADLLAIVAEADIRGRHCADLQGVLDNIALFREMCDEEGCLSSPRPFPTDHTRVTYFRSALGARQPDVLAHDDTRGEMVMMSGLPGSGKDTWVERNLPGWPVVSLDGLRSQLGVDPTEDQGRVRQAAVDAMRTHLRAGQSFVHQATNLDRQRRAPLLSLAADYGFRVRIVYVEAAAPVLLTRNAGRRAAVPERVIARMTERWEVPDETEAHRVERVLW